MITINISLFISIIIFLITILGIIARFITKLEKQKQICNTHEADIKMLKEEQYLICYGMFGCLDGLKQLGANGNVTDIKIKFENHLNKQAHD